MVVGQWFFQKRVAFVVLQVLTYWGQTLTLLWMHGILAYCNSLLWAVLNSALVMGTQQVFPSKSLGGVGFVHPSYGHVHLMGRTYLVLQGLHGHSGFDNHLLPENRWMAGA